MSADNLTELQSAYAFSHTLQRLRAALADAGMRVFAEIDHAEAASSVGLAMPPTVVLIYGNPRGGTPLMLAAPRLALDLPLRVLVREDIDGQVVVAFHNALAFTRPAGLPDELGVNLRKAQSVIAMAIQKA